MNSPTHAPSIAGEFATCLRSARNGCRDCLGHLLQDCRVCLSQQAEVKLGGDRVGRGGVPDLVQDTLLQGLRRFSTFRGRSRDEWLRWLIVILDHRLGRYFHDRHHRDKPLAAGREPRHFDTPSSELSLSEGETQINTALDGLTAEQREVFLYRERDEWSYAKIGVRLDKSADAVRMLYHRAAKRYVKLISAPSSR